MNRAVNHQLNFLENQGAAMSQGGEEIGGDELIPYPLAFEEVAVIDV